MANPQYNQYQQNMHGMPPLQTQGTMQNQHPYSPQSYQPSPGAMSPTSGGVPPAKRQRLSPQPMSPYNSQYNSPFSNSNPPYSTSPYANSPPAQYLPLPHSPAPSQPPTPSFNQPQPYQHPNMPVDYRTSPQSSMPPPKVPASKAQNNDELEKASAKDSNPANLSDVMTGSGVDLQAEEENLLYASRSSYRNTHASGTTTTPQGSFNQWSQQANHGAFQGTGPLAKAVTKEEQEEELRRKHEQVARIRNEAAAQPLADPFLLAAGVRQRMSAKAYEHGVKLDVEGLFDKIPSAVPPISRNSINGSNGESIVELQATSLLNNGAPLVDLISLISLAAEERVRTVIEDAFALAQGRQNTSHGVVPPSFADIAIANGDSRPTEIAAQNISKTSWEAPDSAVSPMTGRLPTPPSEATPVPQPTIQFTTNHVVNTLKRKIQDDQRYEEARIAKRKKREEGSSATPGETPVALPTALPELKVSKKERDRLNKMNQTEDAMHRRANETANMAVMGKKKKYAWMNPGGNAGSGAATPRPNMAAGGSASGAATPAAQQKDKGLLATKRTFRGGNLEDSAEGKKIQLRDLVHVLELDGKGRKALVQILARMRSEDKDAKKVEDRPKAPVPAAR